VTHVLLHLFVHPIHHRGQAHAMLAGTRVAPPQRDEFFMAEELPLREAELQELGLPVRWRPRRSACAPSRDGKIDDPGRSSP
jgi:hypothetical protein